MSLGVWLIVILIASADITVLPMLCWGWVNWFRQGRLGEKASWLSIAALTLASASSLVAIVAILEAQSTPGFSAYDPRLVPYFRYGGGAAILGSLLGGIGALFKNPVRWQAPFSAFSMTLFWIGCAATQ
jgi:hypothetical protein